MRLRLPLSWKIVLWFFLNVLLLALVAVLVVNAQLHFRLDALLAGRAGERIQTMSDLLAGELRDRAQTEWPAVLDRFPSADHVRTGIFRGDGARIAGGIDTLPPEVISRIDEDDRRMRAGRPPRGGPPDPEGFGPPRPAPTAAGHPKFIVRSASVPGFWIITRPPILDHSARPPRPVVFAFHAASLTSGGLLLDYKPWLLAGAGVLLGSVVFWIPLVRGITGTVRQMTCAAGHIARGQFETHVEARRGDELGQLGHALNDMAARLQEFFTGQKRFLGDIAHELCSPLARMEVALSILEQRATDTQRDYVTDVREEVRQMSALVTELLSFSKAGVQARHVELRPLPLAAIAREVIAREAPGRDGVLVQIDDALTVADDGPGVPEEALHRLFDPFFRPEAARTREAGGAGLGLAIVKSCVEACGGTATVRNRHPHGLEVELLLPRAQPLALTA